MPSVILTRSALDGERSAPVFAERGFRVHLVPMIELLDLEPTPELIESVRPLVTGAAVLVTSAHAALRWLDLRVDGFSDDVPGSYYVVGTSTADVLQERDPLVPVRYVARGAVELAMNVPVDVDTVLYPCSSVRREEGVLLLENRGVRVVELPLYRPGLPPTAGVLLERALAAAVPPVAFAFFSPSAVDSFFSLHPDIPPGGIFAAVGATTAQALTRHGVADVVVAPTPSAESLAEELGRRLMRNV